METKPDIVNVEMFALYISLRKSRFLDIREKMYIGKLVLL